MFFLLFIFCPLYAAIPIDNITVNKTTLLTNDSVLPLNATTPIIINMNSSVTQILPNPIFINFGNDTLKTQTINSQPYTLSSLNYNERTIMFFANVVRISYSAYVSLFSGASSSFNPVNGCCFSNSGSLSPLYWNSMLQNAIVSHVKDMVATNKFQHDTCSANLCSQYGSCAYANRMSYFYKKVLLAGENVGFNFVTPVSIFNAYLNSAGHCANLKYPNFREMSSSQINNFWGNDFGGGPVDFTNPLVVGNHFANFDGTVSFYAVYYDPIDKFVPTNAIYVCVNFSDCHLMSTPKAVDGIAKYRTIYSFTMDASQINLKSQSLNTCASYVFYTYKSNKSWARLPEIGSFLTSNYKLCKTSYQNQ